MVDLCDLAGKAYFHPDTKGSSDLKNIAGNFEKVSTPEGKSLQQAHLRILLAGCPASIAS